MPAQLIWTNKQMKRIIVLSILVLLSDNLYSQTIDSLSFEKEPKSINEVIKILGADTVLFYYNDRWQLVKPVCATIFRISRFDPVLATFTGQFIDYYSTDSAKAVEGNYSNGKKEGRYSLYFPSGQLAQTGNYLNDKKNGIWEYYYENGNKKQTLDFRSNEIFITEFWDEKGNKLVESGNGEWFDFWSSKNIRTYGDVRNGRKNGRWRNVMGKMTTNIEKYKDGKFLGGKMISVAETELYKDTLYCTIERSLPFLNAEQFQINRCYRIPKNDWEPAEYPGGMDAFYSEISEKLELSEPITPGVILIHTTIDKDGQMTNFIPISRTGHENDLIHVLWRMKNWMPKKINGKPAIDSRTISFEIR